MAWRQLHDDVPHSRTLGRLTDPAERLYMRMLPQTDQWGRLTGDVDKIRTVCIPTLAWDDQKLHQAVAELERTKAIDRYLENGVWVSQIVNFDDRQQRLSAKRSPSRYPARTLSSISPNDLALSLPLSDTGPEACDLRLSEATMKPQHQPRFDHDEARRRLEAGDSPTALAREYGVSRSAIRKLLERHPTDALGAETPASAGSTDRRQRTEEKRDLPTAEARSPANGLSVSQTIEESLSSGEPMLHAGLTRVPLPDLSQEALLDGGFALLPAGTLGLPPEDLRAIAGRLRDADEGTVNVLAKLRKEGLPPAAFVTALECLDERRRKDPPLKSDVRYVVSALKTMLREGTYRQDGVAA